MTANYKERYNSDADFRESELARKRTYRAEKSKGGDYHESLYAVNNSIRSLTWWEKGDVLSKPVNESRFFSPSRIKFPQVKSNLVPGSTEFLEAEAMGGYIRVKG